MLDMKKIYIFTTKFSSIKDNSLRVIEGWTEIVLSIRSTDPHV